MKEEYPEDVSLFSIGKSGNDEEIMAFRIGEGSLSVMLVGGIHPFEFIGSMMQEYLSHALVEDPELLHDLDVSWTFIKCSDPDRMRINEKCVKEPRTPLNFTSNWFRPALKHQVSCNFPVEYKTWVWKDILPETRCLMDIIDKERVDLLYSLHKNFLSSTWFRVSRECPSLYDKYRQLSTREKIPLQAVNERNVSPSIYLYEGYQKTYDELEKKGIADPAEQLRHGVGPTDYARDRWGAFGLLCEAPYFYDNKITDDSPSGVTKYEAVSTRIEAMKTITEYLKTTYDKIESFLRESTYKVSVEELITRELKVLARLENQLKQDKNMHEPLTVTEELKISALPIFEPDMTDLGMMLGMLKYETEIRTRKVHEIENAIKDISVHLEEKNKDLEKKMTLRASPIRSLVRIQLGTCLHTIDYLKSE